MGSGKCGKSKYQENQRLGKASPRRARVAQTCGNPAGQLIGPMILPGFMMLSGSSAFLIERISDIASPCSS